MSVSVRSLLFPAVAVAAAGTVALSPVLVVAPGHSALAAASIVDVRTADVALAGIGQDIYYAITPTVQYVVGGVSYIINLVPIIGGVIAAQININYFQGIQPIVEATVNALAGAVQDPFAIVATLTTYATTLYDIGYNWVSAELQWAGLAPLPPLPPLPSASLPSASVGESAPRPAAARAAAAVEQPSVRDLRRAARAAVADRASTADAGTAIGTTVATAQGAADAPDVTAANAPTSVANTPTAAATTPTAAADTPGEVRNPARATRGQAARAVRAAAADTAG